MEAKSVFLSMVIITIILNIIYISTTPAVIWTMAVGTVVGMIVTAVTTILLSGIKIMDSGISDTALSYVFTTSLLLNICFSINIYGFSIGLGLMNNVFIMFGGTTLFGLGAIITGIFTAVIFITGIMVITGGG